MTLRGLGLTSAPDQGLCGCTGLSVYPIGSHLWRPSHSAGASGVLQMTDLDFISLFKNAYKRIHSNMSQISMLMMQTGQVLERERS